MTAVVSGLIIDKDLSFEAYMVDLWKKLSKRLGILRHISPYLKQKHRLIFCLAVIEPVMLYLSPIWSSCSKKLLERVLQMQKRVAGIILDAGRTTRTLTMFNEINWIPFLLRDIYVDVLQPWRDLYRLTISMTFSDELQSQEEGRLLSWPFKAVL